MKLDSLCLHAGYEPGNSDPLTLPIAQSTTYKYDSTDHVGQLFDLTAAGHMYSRISNPTVEAVEKKIAALEGGVGAMLTSSGQAATLISVLTIASAGDHVVCSSTVYGGTINLLGVTLKRLGIDITWVNPDDSEEDLMKAFQPNTKALIGETIANPAIIILDIEKFARVAHANGVPLIVDNTFATPILCRPIEYGADIVIHSTSKYLDGHAIQVGGVIIDSGNFDWTNGKYPAFTEPDASYHGIVYTETFGKAAYITKARVQMMRDLGSCMTAINAFLLNLGLETLSLRIRQHSENAEKVAAYLNASDKIESVSYPTVPGNPYADLAAKYLKGGNSGVIAFTIKGGREAAVRFMDALKMSTIAVHVADVRTLVLHPASATHRQLTDEQLVAAGINPGLIRFSCGIEDVEDILADIEQALAQV